MNFVIEFSGTNFQKRIQFIENQGVEKTGFLFLKKIFLKKIGNKNRRSPVQETPNRSWLQKTLTKKLPFFCGAMINQIENRVYICLGQIRNRHQIQLHFGPPFPFRYSLKTRWTERRPSRSITGKRVHKLRLSVFLTSFCLTRNPREKPVFKPFCKPVPRFAEPRFSNTDRYRYPSFFFSCKHRFLQYAALRNLFQLFFSYHVRHFAA